MSTYTILVRCDNCHAVLARHPTSFAPADFGAYGKAHAVGECIQDIAEQHQKVCPTDNVAEAIAYWRDRAAGFGIPFSDRGAPLREHPAGESE